MLLDVNVIIGALLTPNRQSPPAKIVRAFFQRKFTLLLPEQLVEELVRTTVKKVKLNRYITVQEMEWIVTTLERFGERLPLITTKIKPISRDPKDDYLLACSQIGRADYLVTGDEDLLVLKQVGPVKILNPREFLRLL